MAYRMTRLSPQVRVGINRAGALDLEVTTPSDTAPDAEQVSVLVPADAIPGLLRFLQSLNPEAAP